MVKEGINDFKQKSSPLSYVDIKFAYSIKDLRFNSNLRLNPHLTMNASICSWSKQINDTTTHL